MNKQVQPDFRIQKNQNIEKSIAFLYSSNKITENNIKEPILFTLAPKRIKYAKPHLIKEV